MRRLISALLLVLMFFVSTCPDVQATVTTTTNNTAYTGNGATTVYAYSFALQQPTDMQVYVNNVLQTYGTAYTVSINSNGVGGNVTFSVAPPNAAAILLIRQVQLTQQTHLAPESSIPEVVLENAFDKLTMEVQQLQNQASLALQLPITVSGQSISGTLPTPVVGGILGWNATGNGIINIAPVQAGYALLDNGPGVDPSFGPVTSATGGNVVGVVSSNKYGTVIFSDTSGKAIQDGGVGTAGQVWTSNGPGVAPSYQTPTIAFPGKADGRLTLTSNVPVTNTDVTGASTVYYTPYNGDHISSYVTGTWTDRVFSQMSLSVATNLNKVNYDIFDTGSGLAEVAYLSYPATNNPAAGSNVTITMSSTSGISVGDWITVGNAAWSTVESVRVNTVTPNVSVVVDTLANSYTTPTVYTNSQGWTQKVQDGVILNNANNYRWLGTIRMTAGNGTSGGTTEDSAARRFVSNVQNAVTRYIYATDNTTSWTAASAWRATNASTTAGTGRTEFVSCAGTIYNSTYVAYGTTSNSACNTGIAINSINIPAIIATLFGNGGANTINADASLPATITGVSGAGFNFIQNLEYAGSFQGVFTLGGQTKPCTYQAGWVNN